MNRLDYSDFEGFTYRDSNSGESNPPEVKTKPQPTRSPIIDHARIDECLKILSNAGKLITGGVGYSGSWTPQADAWSFLSTNLPVRKWLELAQDAQSTPMLQAYCARAIEAKGLLDDADLDLAFKLLERSLDLNVPINTQSGCIVWSDSLGSIIQGALSRACPASDRPSFADRILDKFASSDCAVDAFSLRLFLPYLSPAKAHLLTQLPKSQLTDGLVLRHRLRLAPDTVSLEEIDNCLAFLSGDIEKLAIETVRDALQILSLRPSKPLLMALMNRVPTLRSYPLIREIPTNFIPLLHDDDIVDALLSTQSALAALPNSSSRIEAFWSFLTPQILKIKKPETLEECIVAWFRSQPLKERQKFLQIAKNRVPIEMLEEIERTEASRRNFMRIVERLWLDFDFSSSQNLNLLFEEKKDDLALFSVIQERLERRFALYEEKSQEAYLKALQGHLCHRDWLKLLAKILPSVTVYNISATLKFVSGDKDGSPEVIEALFAAFCTTDNGHILTPIAAKLIEFHKPDVVRRLEELLTQRYKANELGWSHWGPQGIFELISAAKRSVVGK